MKVWGMTAVAALVLGSSQQTHLQLTMSHRTKAELEDMYNAAYRAFDSKISRGVEATRCHRCAPA